MKRTLLILCVSYACFGGLLQLIDEKAPVSGSSCYEISDYFRKTVFRYLQLEKKSAIQYGLVKRPIYSVVDKGRNLHSLGYVIPLSGSPFDERFLKCLTSKKYLMPDNQDQHQKFLDEIDACLKGVKCTVKEVPLDEDLVSIIKELDGNTRKGRDEAEKKLKDLCTGAVSDTALTKLTEQVQWARESGSAEVNLRLTRVLTECENHRLKLSQPAESRKQQKHKERNN